MSTDPDDLVTWVTVDDLARALGTTAANDPEEAARAVAGANALIHHRLTAGEATIYATSAPLERAALIAAVDLYRRPKTAAGVYQVGEMYARLPADVFTSIAALIAASGAVLETGMA